MERSLRWKTLFLTVLTVLSVLYLVPSITSSLPTWYGDVFGKKVQLGLDLQGGLHIVYGVDLERVVDDKANEIRRDFEEHLEEAGVQAEVITPRAPVGSVYVVPAAGAKPRAEWEKSLLSDYGDDVVRRVSCPATIATPEQALCLRVTSEFAEKIQNSAIDQAIKTIKDRVDRFGIAEATIVRKGFDIIVELPGADKAGIERLKSIIDRTALLEFKIVQDSHPYSQKLVAHVKTDPAALARGIETDVDIWDNEKEGRFTDYFMVAKNAEGQIIPLAEAEKVGCDDPEHKQADGTFKCDLSGRQIMELYMATLPADLQPPADMMVLYEKVVAQKPGLKSKPDISYRSYLLPRSAPLTGTGVAQADVTWNGTTNRPEVLITFNRKGGRAFGDLTTKNVGKKMAIVLDEEVSSAPVIQGPITGGKSTITMGGQDPQRILKDAQDLVNVLRTGALPAPLRQESESQVGATLGQDAIDRAQLSMIVGAALVILMMLYFYRVSGVLANVAMILNILFQMAVLAGFQATLTLPGIAGIVLTIGMAVDSNIVIYERIREELRTGKTIKSAVDAGFNRAFWAVFDAHVTNFVAGFVLLEYGSGPIRGFAVMLLIGVVCNLFTSTWVSRLFFDIWLQRRRNSAEPLSI